MAIRIYISGQITGLDIKVAAENFEQAELKLAEVGHAPVNPMKIVPYDPEWTWEDYMVADIRALFGCEAIFMLSNWEQSKGARIEHAIATQMGIAVHYADNHNLWN